MITLFSFYKPLFMFQLLAAEFLFCCRLRRRSHFWLRYALAVILCFGFSVALVWQPDNAIGLSVIFLLMFSATLGASLFVYDVSFGSLLFCLTSAYLLQHFAYCISNCVLLICGLNTNIYGVYTEEVIIQQPVSVSEMFGHILTFAVYYLSYWLVYLFFSRRIRRDEEPRLKSRSLLPVCVCALALSIVVNAVFVYLATDGDLIMLMNVYNAACCLFIIYVLFNMLKKTAMQRELDAVNRMLSKAEEQYEASKRSIELVNIKCHDLKQQIRTIGRANFINEAAIKEISGVISVYDSAIDTGNGPLDIILTEKSLMCRGEGIAIDCIADGSLLSFMTEAEIYSMFGNAIDNAARAVLAAGEGVSRRIGITVRKVRSFVTVQVRNPFSGGLHLSGDGLPKTTKADGANHGLGLKSIRYIAEKYKGRMSVKTEDNMFYLNIIFPLREHPLVPPPARREAARGEDV